MLRLRGTTQNLAKSILNFNTAISERGTNALTKLETRVQGTVMEKWLKYCKTVYKDYKEAIVDVCVDMKEKPIKAGVIGTTLAGLYYSAVHNPDEKSYRDAYLKASNELILVHPSLQRKESVDHLTYVEKVYNSQRLKRLNFIVGSILWVDRFGDECNVYEAQCSYLQVQYRKFRSRILDVGFLDTWWILRDKMVDFDINY